MSLSEAEEENGQSRIYLGIHWSFDKTEGIAQGRRVADYVFREAFRPLNRIGGRQTRGPLVFGSRKRGGSGRETQENPTN